MIILLNLRTTLSPLFSYLLPIYLLSSTSSSSFPYLYLFYHLSTFYRITPDFPTCDTSSNNCLVFHSPSSRVVSSVLQLLHSSGANIALLGPRGCGKTALVLRYLQSLNRRSSASSTAARRHVAEDLLTLLAVDTVGQSGKPRGDPAGDDSRTDLDRDEGEDVQEGGEVLQGSAGEISVAVAAMRRAVEGLGRATGMGTGAGMSGEVGVLMVLRCANETMPF